MNYDLLEHTGHSYSGISDIVFNEVEKTSQLLLEIDGKYNELIKRQEELEKELERTKSMRGTLVSDFCYIHQAMKLEDKPITFVSDGHFTEVKILSRADMRINYEKYEITHKI